MAKPNKYTPSGSPEEASEKKPREFALSPRIGNTPTIEERLTKGEELVGRRPTMALTPARVETFLADLAKHGVFNAAARTASPHSKSGCVSTFKKLRIECPEFRAACLEAVEQSKGALEQELHRRAVEGWEDPVFQKGEQVGTIRKYSDRLLELAVKAKLPEYREKAQVEHAHAGVFAVTQLSELTGKLSRESRHDLRRIILREKSSTDEPSPEAD